MVLKSSSPYYPTATVQSVTGGPTPDVLIRYRADDSGNRDFVDTAEQPRGVLGIKGVAVGWDYDASFMYGETKLTERYKDGAPLYSKLLPLLNSGQVNFFGPNTPDIEAQIRAASSSWCCRHRRRSSRRESALRCPAYWGRRSCTCPLFRSGSSFEYSGAPFL